MEMTTAYPEFDCPNCGNKAKLETKGLLGGIIQQMFINSVMEHARKRDLTITCKICGCKWQRKGDKPETFR